MTSRVASCRCGQLRATCEGEPVRVSVCHCLNCQKRSGSSFSAQARFAEQDVTIEGATRSWSQAGDEGNRADFLFCPECGSTLAYTNETMPGLVAVAVGNFADPQFPAPQFSVWEDRKHGWVEITGEDVEHWR
jgi:hypothetical protein